MGKKRIGIVAMLSVFMMAACGRTGETVAEINAEMQDVKSITAETRGHITDSVYQDEKELMIDADVDVGDLERLFEITIKMDKEYVQKFINKQIKSEYPEITEDKDENGNRVWRYERDGQLLMSCKVENGGVLYYVDVLNDVNAPYLDEGEHILEYGYITEFDAPDVGLSAEKAAEKAVSYLEEYSSVTFIPWNILAGDRPDEKGKSGYYSISMQPVCEGIPVSVNSDSVAQGFSTTVSYSKDGIFQIQGAFMFSALDSVEIERIVSLNSVMKQLKSSVAAFSEGDVISVNYITLEYFPKMNSDGSYTLSPVWDFYCTDTRTELIDGGEKEISLRYNYLYFAEDGELCGIYYS